MTVSDRDLQILNKIQGYCSDIEFTHAEYGHNYTTFCENPTYRNAIALCLLQIGELVKSLSQEFTASHTNIPWRAIRGMRNVVAHEYGHIDLETVWKQLTLELLNYEIFVWSSFKLMLNSHPFPI